MKKLLVTPGTKVNLDRTDPDDSSLFGPMTKEAALQELDRIKDEMRAEQAKLIASRRSRVLIILQSLDAGGKDGTIRNVFSGLDPHELVVRSFKAPTQQELAHDYLWRVHQQVPGDGEIAVFNRSHYEDIVAVRVKKLAGEAVWRRRYKHVLAFEEMLADEGTLILKFFLHISPEEQRKRFESRLTHPNKHWKICEEDLNDRARFGQLLEAYSDVISQTSSVYAPWFVVPANVKWYRNLVVAQTVLTAMKGLALSYPPLQESLKGVVIGPIE